MKDILVSELEEHTIGVRILRLVNRVTGLPPALAQPIAKALEEELRREFSGERYLAYMTRAERTLRKMRIVAEYDGNNSAQLCRKYHIGRRTLQLYLKELSPMVEGKTS